MSEPTAADRLLRAFRVLVPSTMPEARFHGLYEYKVVGSSAGTVDCRPADPEMGLPDLAKVPVLPSAMGELVTANSGSACAIMFLDGKPTKPRCVSIEAPSDVVRAYADDLYLGASSSRGVARDADTITLGYFIWDPTIFTLYYSPAILGPLLTVYVVWAVYTTNVYASGVAFPIPPPTPGVPPPPGTPGWSWAGQINSASTRVWCA